MAAWWIACRITIFQALRSKLLVHTGIVGLPGRNFTETSSKRMRVPKLLVRSDTAIMDSGMGVQAFRCGGLPGCAGGPGR